MKLHFLGADDGVTGSRHLVDSAGSRILLDCGLFQGWKAHRERNWLFPDALRTLDAVVVSHAHLDHSGWLPVLVKHGYRGPVHASPATCALLQVLLLDSAHLQEEDARRANRYGYSRHEKALPLYTRADAQRALSLLVPLPPGRAASIARHTVTLTPVGHLLGACAVTLQEPGGAGRRLVFSGDLGRQHDLLMPPPEPVTRADVLLVESTYGNRLHPAEDGAAKLADIVQGTLQRGGSVLLPAFAVGRARRAAAVGAGPGAAAAGAGGAAGLAGRHGAAHDAADGAGDPGAAGRRPRRLALAGRARGPGAVGAVLGLRVQHLHHRSDGRPRPRRAGAAAAGRRRPSAGHGAGRDR